MPKKRSDGRYCAQIYLGRDEEGRKRYRAVYAKSPALLKEKEAEIRRQLGIGLDFLSQRDSFGQWADDVERVLLELQESGFAARTVNFYRPTIRQIMQRAVGRVIPSNPVDLVQLTQPAQTAEKRRALTAEEQQWIWDTPHRVQPTAVIYDVRRTSPGRAGGAYME